MRVIAARKRAREKLLALAIGTKASVDRECRAQRHADGGPPCCLARAAGLDTARWCRPEGCWTCRFAERWRDKAAP